MAMPRSVPSHLSGSSGPLRAPVSRAISACGILNVDAGVSRSAQSLPPLRILGPPSTSRKTKQDAGGTGNAAPTMGGTGALGSQVVNKIAAGRAKVEEIF